MYQKTLYLLASLTVASVTNLSANQCKDWECQCKYGADAKAVKHCEDYWS